MRYYSSMKNELKWELVPWEGNPSMGEAWRAKIRRGYLWLLPFDTTQGISYVSSFGADSDDSFSGFLPGLTIEQAKMNVLNDAAKHWK